jgi:septum formation inhibitor MinC
MLFLNVPTYDSVATVASDDHKSTTTTRKKMHVVEKAVRSGAERR